MIGMHKSWVLHVLVLTCKQLIHFLHLLVPVVTISVPVCVSSISGDLMTCRYNDQV